MHGGGDAALSNSNPPLATRKKQAREARKGKKKRARPRAKLRQKILEGRALAATRSAARTLRLKDARPACEARRSEHVACMDAAMLPCQAKISFFIERRKARAKRARKRRNARARHGTIAS